MNPDRFFVLTLDVAQVLAPVSSGLLAAGAPASDGANGDGGDFAALLTALAGVLGANRLTPAAVSPHATAQVATKSEKLERRCMALEAELHGLQTASTDWREREDELMLEVRWSSDDH